MALQISETYDELCQTVCDAICEVLRKAAAQKRTCSIGLSGGSMPQMISGICAHSKLPWHLAHFFYCDERMVPVTDSESTHRAYMEHVYSKLSIPSENIHTVKTNRNVHDAAKDYHEQLLSYFGACHGYPTFDLLLLGIGPDGHTCSLFPGHPLLHSVFSDRAKTGPATYALDSANKPPGGWITNARHHARLKSMRRPVIKLRPSALQVEDRSVAAIEDSPKPPPQRVTLTLPVLNKAKHVFFIVSGANKADAVAQVFTKSGPPSRLPCALVQPIDGELIWYLDKTAASKIVD